MHLSGVVLQALVGQVASNGWEPVTMAWLNGRVNVLAIIEFLCCRCTLYERCISDAL